MKFNKTVLGVVVFVIALIFGGYSAVSEADQKFHLGVGKTVINSSLKVGEVGYEIKNWEFNAALMQDGDTKNGYQEQSEIYSISYLTKPQWSYKGIDPYFRLGLSKNNGSELVGDENFRLGVGLDFHDVWRVEWVHHSSAGIQPINTGYDIVTLYYQFDPFWR